MNQNDIRREKLLEELENMGISITWNDVYIALRDYLRAGEGK